MKISTHCKDQAQANTLRPICQFHRLFYCYDAIYAFNHRISENTFFTVDHDFKTVMQSWESVLRLGL